MADAPKIGLSGRQLLLLLFLATIVFMVFNTAGGRQKVRQVRYDEFMGAVHRHEIKRVKIDPNEHALVGFKEGDGTLKALYLGDGNDLLERLRLEGAEVEALSVSSNSWFGWIMQGGVWILFLGMLLLPLLLMRRAGQPPGGITGFGASKAKQVHPEKISQRFSDVLGVDEAVGEVRDIVEFLRDPGKFLRLGGKIAKSVLLVGPPGCGKTLLARAVAGEAGVPFFAMSGSDFVEMFVGVGASRVRDLFEKGRKHAPAIFFIDELDGVGRHRGAGLGGGHDEREQTLNQLLVEMDGFETLDDVVIFAATNRPDVLDPALVERFKRKVHVPKADGQGRLAILRHYAAKLKLAEDVRFGDSYEQLTEGMSGRVLDNLVNEAALEAARRKAPAVAMCHFDEALDKTLLGPPSARPLPADERGRVAVHESGHALMAVIGGARLHKVTIRPRGPALGMTVPIVSGSRRLLTERRLRDQIAITLGGRVAEKIVFGDLSTGAADDLQRATGLARAMIAKFSMSEKLGPVSYDEDAGEIFLGRSFAERRPFSEETAREIDLEASALLKEMERHTQERLTASLEALKRIAKALEERETLSGAELESLAGPLAPHQ